MKTLEQITTIITTMEDETFIKAQAIEDMYFEGKEKTADKAMQKLCGLTIDEWFMWAAQ